MASDGPALAADGAAPGSSDSTSAEVIQLGKTENPNISSYGIITKNGLLAMYGEAPKLPGKECAQRLKALANYREEFLERVVPALEKAGDEELDRDQCWRPMSDHTCMWEKYSHPTVISNGRGGFSYHSGNTWGCEQFFRPGEEVISGAVFCARVLLAGRSSGVKITNKAVNIEDFDDFEDVLWFNEQLLMEAIQKKWGGDEDGFDADEFTMALHKMYKKIKTPWMEIKSRATMGGKITEVGIKALYGFTHKLGQRPTAEEKHNMNITKMTGSEFCRRLERARAEADWEFVGKFYDKVWDAHGTDENLYNWMEMMNLATEAFFSKPKELAEGEEAAKAALAATLADD